METYLIYNHADDRLYLAHHGVQGMHWGVRRYQPYGQGYDRKGGKTGVVKIKGYKEIKEEVKNAPKGSTGFGKRMGIRANAYIEGWKAIPRDFKNAKTWHRKVSAIMGHEHAKSKAIIRANAQRKLTDASKTAYWKITHDTRRVNAENNAKYQEALLKMTKGERFREAIRPTLRYGTEVSTRSGRSLPMGQLAYERKPVTVYTDSNGRVYTRSNAYKLDRAREGQEFYKELDKRKDKNYKS